MLDSKYWVGLVRQAGHPLGTFLLGEFIVEEEKKLIVRNTIRAIEMPGNQGMALNFMQDNFFTVDNQTTVEKDCLMLWRLLDPEQDAKHIVTIKGYLMKIRAARAGLVAGGGAPGTPPGFGG